MFSIQQKVYLHLKITKNDNIPIKNHTLRKKPVYSVFDGEEIVCSDVLKKYGIHSEGYKQYQAVTEVIKDGCVEYLQFANENGYAFVPIQGSCQIRTDLLCKTKSDYHTKPKDKPWNDKTEQDQVIVKAIEGGKLSSLIFYMRNLITT